MTVELPSQSANEQLSNSGLGLYPSTGATDGAERITLTLPDNNLPPGFVPLSPMSGMSDLNPYPPGFGPSLPKDNPANTRPTNYTYPASPLIRGR